MMREMLFLCFMLVVIGFLLQPVDLTDNQYDWPEEWVMLLNSKFAREKAHPKGPNILHISDMLDVPIAPENQLMLVQPDVLRFPQQLVPTPQAKGKY